MRARKLGLVAGLVLGSLSAASAAGLPQVPSTCPDMGCDVARGALLGGSTMVDEALLDSRHVVAVLGHGGATALVAADSDVPTGSIRR